MDTKHVRMVTYDLPDGAMPYQQLTEYYHLCVAERDVLREDNKALLAALEDAANCIDMLGKNCLDRIWDGERGNPVTAKGARAAIAKSYQPTEAR